ncbi:MAG: hypothetical protein Q4G45_03750 [Actinomycetia bacterium]|nr:hypothetical protein [Actinomycetes bacterium]
MLKVIASLIKLRQDLLRLVAKFIDALDPTNWKEIVKSAGDVLADAAGVQDEAFTGMLEYIRTDINNMAKIQQDSLAVHQLPGGAASWPEPHANIDANIPGGWSAK